MVRTMGVTDTGASTTVTTGVLTTTTNTVSTNTSTSSNVSINYRSVATVLTPSLTNQRMAVLNGGLIGAGVAASNISVGSIQSGVSPANIGGNGIININFGIQTNASITTTTNTTTTVYTTTSTKLNSYTD